MELEGHVSCLGVGKDKDTVNRSRGMSKKARLLWEVAGEGHNYRQVVLSYKKGTRKKKKKEKKKTRNWSPDKTQIHMRRLPSHSRKCSWAGLEGVCAGGKG